MQHQKRSQREKNTRQIYDGILMLLFPFFPLLLAVARTHARTFTHLYMGPIRVPGALALRIASTANIVHTFYILRLIGRVAGARATSHQPVRIDMYYFDAIVFHNH